MQTRFYDSAEPGPPHGWLDMGAPSEDPEMKVWEKVIPWVLRVEHRAKDGTDAAFSIQYWGGLRWNDRWWVYRLLPAGLDRHGRPGRTLTVLFCATDKQGFEWETVGSMAYELDALAKDRGHLSAVQRLLHQARSGKTLTDDLLKQPQKLFSEPLKSALLVMTAGLQQGEHEHFMANADGLISNRIRETFAPPPSHPPAVEIPSAKPSNEGKPSTSMRIGISHFIFVIFGLIIGYALQPPFFAPKPSPERSELTFTSVKDAILVLRKATDYIEGSLEPKLYNSGPASKRKQSEGFSPAQGNQ